MIIVQRPRVRWRCPPSGQIRWIAISTANTTAIRARSPTHTKTICCHEVDQVQRDQGTEHTEDRTDFSPGRLKDAAAENPFPLLDRLGTESQHDHVDRHDQSNNHQDDMKSEKRDKHIAVETLGSAESLFSFKGQHA